MSMIGSYNFGGQMTLNMPGLDDLAATETQTGVNTTNITTLQTNTGTNASYTGQPLTTRIQANTDLIGDNASDITALQSVDSDLNLLISSNGNKITDLETKTGADNTYTGSSLTARIGTLESSVSGIGAPVADTYINTETDTSYFTVYQLSHRVVKVNNGTSGSDDLNIYIYAGIINYDPGLLNPPAAPQPTEWQDGDILEVIHMRRQGTGSNNRRTRIHFRNEYLYQGGKVTNFHSLPVFVNKSLGSERNLSNVGQNGHFQISLKTASGEYIPTAANDSDNTYYRYRVWRIKIPDEMKNAAMSAYSSDLVLSDPNYWEESAGVNKDCIIFMLEQRQ